MSYLVTLATFLLYTAFYLIFVFAPLELTQGAVQKIFYFHVSCAMAMYAGFGIAGISSLLYVIQKKRGLDQSAANWDFRAHAGVSVGVLFCAMVLMSGPIWARPIWGVYWTWDPRLTTTLILFLIFVGVLWLRRFMEGNPNTPLYAAILTLFGICDLPLVFFAVKFWRGVHPSVLGQKDSMPVEMRITLIVTNLAVLALFVTLFWLKVRVLRLEEKLER